MGVTSGRTLPDRLCGSMAEPPHASFHAGCWDTLTARSSRCEDRGSSIALITHASLLASVCWLPLIPPICLPQVGCGLL